VKERGRIIMPTPSPSFVRTVFAGFTVSIAAVQVMWVFKPDKIEKNKNDNNNHSILHRIQLGEKNNHIPGSGVPRL
jgi:hypothetical protein